jgi:sterol 24-C-methyltransferase
MLNSSTSSDDFSVSSGLEIQKLPTVRMPGLVQAVRSYRSPDAFFEQLTRRFGRTFEMSWHPFGRTVMTSDTDIVRQLFSKYGDYGPVGMRPAPGTMVDMLGNPPLIYNDSDERIATRRARINFIRAMAAAARTGEGRLQESLLHALDSVSPQTSFSFRRMINSVLLEALLCDAFHIESGANLDRLIRIADEWVDVGARPVLLDNNLARTIGRSTRSRRQFTVADTILNTLLAEEIAKHKNCKQSGRGDCVIQMSLDESAEWSPDDPVAGTVSCIKEVISGGYHITGTAISWTILFLLHNPEILDEVRLELCGGSGALLEASIRESLRLRPPTPYSVVRIAHDDMRLGFYHIAAGTTLAVNARLIHQDESVYDNPLTFTPRRFMGENRRRPAHEWLPFGGGIGCCLGEIMAIERAELILSYVLLNCELALVSDEIERGSRKSAAIVPECDAQVMRLSQGAGSAPPHPSHTRPHYRRRTKGIADEYLSFHAADKNVRKDNYSRMVNHYYDLATDFYESGWGESFHFAPRYVGEALETSLVRHELQLALALSLRPGMKVLDVGCGIGGPMRSLARFSGAHIVGVNINAYQVERAEQRNRETRLSDCCEVLNADFMKLPVPDKTFDAVYAIEATCHAPDKVKLFSELNRVMKDGAEFAGYEWCLTDRYDQNNAEHRAIKTDIEVGDALPDIWSTHDVVEALQKAGFDILDIGDLAAASDPETPWFLPLVGDWSLSGFKHTPTGRWFTRNSVRTLEAARIAPKGSATTLTFLNRAATGVVRGGQTGIFTPMFYFHVQKPALSHQPQSGHSATRNHRIEGRVKHPQPTI